MSSDQKILENLRNELHRHTHLYYVKDAPIISDYEFDLMLKKLIDLELKFPQFFDSNSPSQRVGGKVSKKFNNVKHEYPMYSLDNSYSKKDLDDFNTRVIKKIKNTDLSYLCELKFDGVSINLTYENGFLVRAVTRGDGVCGDDVTENIKTIKTIPLKLKGNYPQKFQIRGEIFIELNDFNQMNVERSEIGLDLYMNPRNTASGSLKLQDSSEVANRPLKCFLYQVVSEDDDSKTQYENLISASNWGFNVSNSYKLCNSIDEVFDFINYWDKKRINLDFEIDGIVIKVNQIDYQKTLGFTSKYPRWSIAYKFKTLQAATVLSSISYQVGRTGAVTPVANLKPVLLGGTIVKRASLHNEDQINKLNLHLNDHVLIEKGGEIIPKIVGVQIDKRDLFSNRISFIKKCPSCESDLSKNELEAHHYCLNFNFCPTQITGRIQHFISRKAMDINGIGNETIQLLFQNKLVTNYADLYTLKKEDLLSLDRMAEKSVDNIFKGLNDSRKIPFERVLFALGIRYVGQTVSKNLAKKFQSIDNLISQSYDELLLVDEIGERISKSVVDFFKNENNILNIDKLKKHGLQFKSNLKTNISNILINKTFVVSGFFQNYSRIELKNLIELNGGKNLSSISSKTNYLIAGDKMGPSKLKKAKDLAVEIITEQDFNKLLKFKS
ncbi:NAD-dependent DNA ligase LigA [Flavobacteriaceae bacterium]|jgi:DNA ligase (NAD+)|nr:NAD-dependent DNA ligase LigA [Flavobacteriaceae bacterium]MDB4239469.1 NAD-dependent DNA ligase LigA [Flavobacteriaceae bacterium]MDB9902541.1 NAD-dependent DNA ligase LigA [Flavobacteriaceae bacterium]MDC0958269.1 NAD-dependent DNA ligase LigA [Flavobacteriaceae bacterium]